MIRQDGDPFQPVERLGLSPMESDLSGFYKRKNDHPERH
jgi:hypothetical protein